MTDFYIAFFLMLVSTIIALIIAIVLYIKSRFFLSYLKKNHPSVYFDELELIKGPFGTMQNGMGFIRYIYSQNGKENKEIIRRKKSYKKTILFFLVSLALIIVCSLYLYLKFNGVMYIG